MDKFVKTTIQPPSVQAKNPADRKPEINLYPSNDSPTGKILGLQKTIGNTAVRRLIDSGKARKGFIIGQSGDCNEKEADLASNAVMRNRQSNRTGRRNTVSHNRVIVHTATKTVQDPGAQAYTSGNDAEQNTILSPSGGSRLSYSVRENLEPVFGENLESVRIHNDSSAHRAAGLLHAKAFTNNRHIWLGSGQTPDNLHLMAHETAHVIQQSRQNNQGNMIQCAPAGDQPTATGENAGLPGSDGPPILFCKNTDNKNIYVSVASRERSIAEIAVYLYGSPDAAEKLRQTNGDLPEQLKPGRTLMLTGDNLTPAAYKDLNDALGNGTILRTKGMPTKGEEENHMYRFSAAGREFILTETQLHGMFEGLKAYLINKADYVKGLATGHKETHADHLKETNSLVRGISNMLGGTTDPPVFMWNSAIETAERVRTYLEEEELTGDRITRAAKILQAARDAYADSVNIWNQYINATIAGAGSAVSTLEFTRDLSFGIAIGIGAVVAFPVVAGAAATTLGTGAIASGAIAATGIIGAGAGARGVVQSGSNAVGQALTGEKVDWRQVANEYVSGYKSGAVDAASGLIAAGVGGKISGSMARYTGEFATAGQRIATNAIAAGASGVAAGGFAGGTNAALAGKSGSKILESTLYGGLLGGGLGIAGAVLGPVLNRIFPFQYGPGARSFRLSPNEAGYMGPKPPVPRMPTAGKQAPSPGTEETIVETSAGNLENAIQTAKKSPPNTRVIAIDKELPPQEAIAELEKYGGKFIQSSDLSQIGEAQAGRIVVHYPWKTGETLLVTKEMILSGKFPMITEQIPVESLPRLKVNGELEIVTELKYVVDDLVAIGSKQTIPAPGGGYYYYEISTVTAPAGQVVPHSPGFQVAPGGGRIPPETHVNLITFKKVFSSELPPGAGSRTIAEEAGTVKAPPEPEPAAAKSDELAELSLNTQNNEGLVSNQNEPGYMGPKPPGPDKAPAAETLPIREGLETRGVTPPPGSRVMTQEQWKAQYRTQRLEAGDQPVRVGFGRQQRAELIRFWREQIRGLPKRTDLSPAEINTWRRRYFANIQNLEQRAKPHWRQSEAEMQYYYSQIGGTPEVPYLYGHRATRFTPGHTRPDSTLSSVMIESKRYTLFDSQGHLDTDSLENRLIPVLRKQIGDRAIHGPAYIRQQSVILDLRGQRFEWTEVTAAARRIAAELSDELSQVLGRPTIFNVSDIQIVHN